MYQIGESMTNMYLLKSIDSDVNRNSFSHTHVFNVTAGCNAFYSVAENYINQNGTGIASFYGHLVVKYFPDLPLTIGKPCGLAKNISKTRINVRDNPVKLDTITLTSKSGGTVYLRFNGQCVPDIGDRFKFAASDTEFWGTDDDGISAETPDISGFYVPFSNSRVHTFTGGSNTFYASLRIGLRKTGLEQHPSMEPLLWNFMPRFPNLNVKERVFLSTM